MPIVSSRWPLPRALSAMASLLVAGCASAGTLAPSGRIVWPAPPDSARFVYVRAIATRQDIAGRSGTGVTALAAGQDNTLFSRPYGVAADGADRLYVADPVGRVLWRLDFASRTASRIGAGGQVGLERPCCVTVSRDGTVYVSEPDAHRIVVFDRSGAFVRGFGGSRDTGRPAGLALDEARGRLYVADMQRHAVRMFDLATGEEGTGWGRRGGGEGEFNLPLDVAVDSIGRVYVLDALNFRVQRFDTDGEFLESVGTAGDNLGSFARPKGIALDGDGNLYVVDAAFGNVQIFDQQFDLLLVVGENGTGPGQFTLPAGIAVACDGTVYVADGLNARIQVLRRTDAVSSCSP